METLTTFSHVVTDAVSHLNEPGFAEALSVGIQQWVGADDTALIRYQDTGAPTIEYTLPLKRRGKTTLDRYVTGPFLLDPFYRAATIDGQFGVFQLNELAPTGFKESEYYRTWYRDCGFQDECGLLIKLTDGVVNLAFGMTEGSRLFSKRQINLLEAIFPVVEALTRRHWHSAASPASDQFGLRQRLHVALSAFGASVLTRREREVIELVLLGNSTRLIAEKLQISTETIKLHRKHAYAKLDISSQAELFYLFVDAIACHTGTHEEDPLLSYHSQRP
ncbi:MAG: helix-turn-helix transcriptional regulator [Halieaceae bacterium]|jgi:DNA-binding CsgD family transcriptional regulator|nr:helix-turn-helix transcriptional regulator [Halieaceae bacterium]